MKRMLLVAAVFFFSLEIVICPANAVMVHYVDDQGKVKYVNTDLANVPEEYLPQVQDQLKAAQLQLEGEESLAENSGMEEDVPQADAAEGVSNPPPLAVPTATPAVVSVFVDANCSECFAWEAMLREERIPYARYDVKYHQHGKEVYAQLGGGILPITMVGAEVIRGKDMAAIQKLFKKNTEEPAPEAGAGP